MCKNSAPNSYQNLEIGESNILFGKQYGKQNVRLSPQPLCFFWQCASV